MQLEKKYHDKIIDFYKKNDWKIDDFNLINFRNLYNLRNDCFNDLSGYFTEDGTFVHQSTTDPGKRTIDKKGPGHGALFLAEGFHENGLCIDIHNKRIGKAFCFRPEKRYLDEKWAGCKPHAIIRDKEADYDIENNKISYDGVGDNVHPASKYVILDKIGLYGAGCRVYLVWSEFQHALKRAMITDMYLKNSNVTLFSESLFHIDNYDFAMDIYKEFYQYDEVE